MSRITGSDAQGLMEAYASVYYPQELTEDQVWEEVEVWVNSLVEEGYDLSEYTWEDMYESYIEEQGSTPQQRAAAQQRAQQQTQTALNQGRGIEVRNPGYRGPLSPTSTGYQATSGGRTGVLVRGANAPVQTGRATSTPGVNRARPITAGGQTLYPAAKGNDIIYLPGRSSTAPAPARPAAPAPARPAAPAPARPAAPAATPARPAPAPATPAATSSARPVPTPAPKPQLGSTGKPLVGGIERRTPTSAELRQAQQLRTSGSNLTGAGALAPSKTLSTASRNLSGTGALATRPATPAPAPAATAPKPNLQQQIRQRRLNMDFDPFDIVQGYLIDEGYAETEEAAAVIMANMSEDWRDSIVEEVLDEASVYGARKGTIRSVIAKGGGPGSIKYVASGGDIIAGDRAAQERSAATERKRARKNRANAARLQNAHKKSIQQLNAKSGDGDYDAPEGHHYDSTHSNRAARRRRETGR